MTSKRYTVRVSKEVAEWLQHVGRHNGVETEGQVLRLLATVMARNYSPQEALRVANRDKLGRATTPEDPQLARAESPGDKSRQARASHDIGGSTARRHPTSDQGLTSARDVSDRLDDLDDDHHPSLEIENPDTIWAEACSLRGLCETKREPSLEELRAAKALIVLRRNYTKKIDHVHGWARKVYADMLSNPDRVRQDLLDEFERVQKQRAKEDRIRARLAAEDSELQVRSEVRSVVRDWPLAKQVEEAIRLGLAPAYTKLLADGNGLAVAELVALVAHDLAQKQIREGPSGFADEAKESDSGEVAGTGDRPADGLKSSRAS